MSQPWVAGLVTKQYGIEIDVDHPNVEVITEIDIDKAINLIHYSVKNVSQWPY